MSILKDLRDFWNDVEERRPSIVGIGSDIRGDEGVGLKIIDHLKRKKLKNVLLLRTETRPENFIGEIQRHKATHVLLVQSAHLDGKPGEARFIPFLKDEQKTKEFHETPLQTLSHFFEKFEKTRVKFMGIQPKSTFFGTKLTQELDIAAREIAELIANSLSDSSNRRS